MRFVKGFEYIVLIAAIIFLFIIIFITIRQVKKLPLSYAILILDNHGEKNILPDLRLNFRKYEVAESYAQFYRAYFSPTPVAVYEGETVASNMLKDNHVKPNYKGVPSVEPIA